MYGILLLYKIGSQRPEWSNIDARTWIGAIGGRASTTEASQEANCLSVLAARIIHDLVLEYDL